MTGTELVRSLYRAFAARDHEALRLILAPDVEWAQSPGFPHGAVRRGVDTVLAGIVGAFEPEWQDWRFHPADFIEGETAVVVLGAYRGRNRATGKDVDSMTAHVFDIVDGRIIRFRQYSDSHVVHQAMALADVTETS